jgi:DNA replication protein DnaC
MRWISLEDLTVITTSERPWESSYIDLKVKFFSDRDRAELYEEFGGELPESVREGCPTCFGKNSIGERVKVGNREHQTNAGWTPCFCQEQLSRYKHYLWANIGDVYQRLDWDDWVGEQHGLDVVTKYLVDSDQMLVNGMGLIMTGPYGTGKTMLASLMAKAMVRMGHDVYFSTFTQMVETFTGGWFSDQKRRKFEERIVGADFLVLDDLGKEMKTKTNLAESTFDNMMRRRAMFMRPTILTTNMPMENMREGYGRAAFSLLSERSTVVEFFGEDWRPKANLRTEQEISDHIRRPIY